MYVYCECAVNPVTGWERDHNIQPSSLTE